MTEPSKKSEGMKQLLDDFTLSVWGRTRIDSIKQDICVGCGEEATSFTDAVSRKEYSISGLCQVCQDKVFGTDEEEEYYEEEADVLG